MNHLKVLHICEAYGGGLKKHLDLISELMSSQIENHFYISPSIGEAVDLKSNNIVNDKSLSLRGRSKPLHLIKAAVNIVKLINEIKPSVIHFHSTFAGILSILIKPFLDKSKVKFIYTPHAYFSQKDISKIKLKIVKKIERRILKNMDNVIHVSKQEEEHCFDSKLLTDEDKNKSVVIYNGVKDPQIRKHEKNKDNVVFVNVARCIEQKNPKLFLDIALEYLKINSNAEFIYVGDGPLMDEVQVKIDENKMNSKIKFVGYSSCVQNYLKKADFYLSTSKYEGMPYAVIEGMSVGLPLILSDVIGHGELINDNGYLFEINDLNNTIDILLRVSHLDNEEYKRFSDKSLSCFKNKFEATHNIREIERIYK